jgi:acyl-CoA reductase-like NAD-dependent aldehyde dehydrogenase
MTTPAAAAAPAAPAAAAAASSASAAAAAPAARRELLPRYPYYLANRPVQANEALVVTNKYTGKPATRVAQASAAVIDEAIAAAAKAAPLMAALSSFERKAILKHLVDGVTARREELAVALCIEAGKPIRDSRGEVTRAITTLTLAMEESTRIYGEFAPMDVTPDNRGYSAVVKRFPIGPVSMISPFNFPINLAIHKIAPALAVGCPWVLKPASRTPVSALIIGDILSQCALLPPGAFSILPCSRDGADLFTTDDRFRLVSFTGSPAVGWELKARAGRKKVVLELGGNAAVIIDEGTDIADAVERCVFGAFYQSGQSCISVQRMYVHASLYDAFVSAFVARVRALKKGDPLDEETFIGPLISEDDAKRLEAWVNEAVAAGARVLCGHKRDGAFYDATVVENAPRGSKLREEEAFGTVVCMERFSDFKAAVAAVNDSKFGLQAGVFTRSWDRSWYAFEQLDVGGVVINDVPSKRVDSQPYGGVKDSGLGREGVRYAMEDMTEPRVMLMRNAGKI